MAAIAPQIESTEQSQLTRRRPDNLSAYHIAVRAWKHALEALGKAVRALLEKSIEEARQALAIDPTSARTLQAFAYSRSIALLLNMAVERDQALAEAT